MRDDYTPPMSLGPQNRPIKWLAGLLSFLFPGLGHYYAGAPGRAWIVLIVFGGLVPIAIAWAMVAGPPALGMRLLLLAPILSVAVFWDAWRTASQSKHVMPARKRMGRLIAFWIATIIVGGLSSTGHRSFIAEPMRMPSESMLPTIHPGEYLLLDKRASARTALSRGDIVVFPYPDDPSQDFIKRIVGMPGDRIQIREGRLYVNGQLVDRIPDGSFTYDDAARGVVEARRFTERNPEGVEYTLIRTSRRDPAVPRGPASCPRAGTL